MVNAQIEKAWEAIRKKERSALVAGYQPLVFIDDYLSHFNLPLLPDLNVHPESLTDIDRIEPSFEALTDNITFTLRHHVYTRTKPDIVDKWAEKLMRFCEIRYRVLKERSVKKCGGKDAAQVHILQLACFFMDHSLATKDLRFLNIALKLADLNWLLNDWASDSMEEYAGLSRALFQFRLVLLIEYAMDLLQEGGKK
jgi:hypothetical protein